MVSGRLVTIVGQLSGLGFRQGKQEEVAANFLMQTLKENSVVFDVHEFGTAVPLTRRARLFADDVSVPCEGCAFVDGEINGKNHLTSSLIRSKYLLEVPNINFNPECDGLSLSNFYFAPALAVARSSVSDILAATEVRGEVKVDKYDYRSRNILIGNVSNPRVIVFAHYDSIHNGAIDNSSGVAVVLDILLSEPKCLQDNLFVLAGNEELSYDKPIYWGHGYRALEKDLGSVFDSCEQMIVVDSIGNGPTQVDQDQELIYLGFPLSEVSRWQDKIWMVYGDMRSLMTVYHSALDGIDRLRDEYLGEARALLRRKIGLDS